MTNKSKVIDYLSEDPAIPGQKYALVSIVGPNMPQKCDVWGLKVRGVADSLEKCKQMSKKIMRVDNNYDIYNVEVGKFFPLEVNPFDVGKVEYQNEQLNALIKNYLENREQANEEWQSRKQEMMKEAIREGKNQQELQNRPEHPIAVLQRLNNQTEKVKQLKEQLESLENDLKLTTEKYASYSEEEKQAAEQELKNAISEHLDNENIEEITSEEKEKTIEQIRNEIVNELNDDNIDVSLEQMKNLEKEIEELNEKLQSLNSNENPNEYSNLLKQLNEYINKKEDLLKKLNNTNVNDYINEHYASSSYNYIEKNV